MSNDSSQTRRRQAYFEEHWQSNEHNPSTGDTSDQPELHYQQSKELQGDKKKKKKSRGNRKLQRFRAKLKKQGLDEAAISRLLNESNDPSRHNDEHEKEKEQVLQQEKQQTVQTKRDKRKRESRPTTAIPTSSSHITIAQPSTKRQRSTTIDNISKLKNIDELKSDHMPKYLNVPDHIFKNMLATSLQGMENFIQTLDTTEKLQYSRLYAHLINNLFYVKLKQDFWNYYYQVVITEGAGGGLFQISKQMIKDNNLHRIQYSTEDRVKIRQNKIIEQLQQVENELNKHLLQAGNQTIDINRLSTIIPAFVRRGQRKLVQDFQRKKLLLQLDVNEYHTVQSFYDLNPSEDQIRSTKLIWQTTIEKQRTEEYMAILKQRIYSKRLPSSFNLLDHSIDSIERILSQKPILEKNKSTTILNERSKMIAKYKSEMMSLTIQTTEELIRSHTNIIVNEKRKLIDSAITNGQIPLPKSLTNILNAIQARQSNIIKRAEIMTKQNHILPSASIVEVASSLRSRQITFLANGLKYIPICQSRFSKLPIESIIDQEYKKLVDLLTIGFNDNCMSMKSRQAIEFLISLKNLLRQLYTKPLSPRLLARVQYDNQTVKSIRYILKKENIVIQKTDKSKVFHLGSAQSYHEKTLTYMQKTNAYQEIENGINPCSYHLRQVLTLIDRLLKNGAMDLNTWKQSMYPNAKTVELPYLYPVPKTHKMGTPIRPIISSLQAPSLGISQFLDQLLRPFYDEVAAQTTFINDIHFIRRLELYQNLGYLTERTILITFDVTDLYTMIPRDGALLALEEFLCKVAKRNGGRINNMTINTIMQMARLVLDTNSFLFDRKYYRQIRGGAMGSPFTMTLANIYMLKWEQPLIEFQRTHNELFGRYLDDVFMTTKSLNQIMILLNEMEKKDENIRITRSFGTTIEFLDVLVENMYGQLKTSVFHKPAAQPYIVPFQSDHPRYIHRNAIKGALFRAVRLSSNVEDFSKERLNIELTLLWNGYPPRFISYHFKQFFEQNNAISLMEQLDHDIYKELHQKLLHQLTKRERERKNIILDSNKKEQQRQNWNKKEIRIYYTFESGPLLSFKKQFRQLWKKHFIYPGSPINGVNLKIGIQTNKSLSQLLIKKKSPRSMLINADATNTK